jgi:hypothetical protein
MQYCLNSSDALTILSVSYFLIGIRKVANVLLLAAITTFNMTTFDMATLI